MCSAREINVCVSRIGVSNKKGAGFFYAEIRSIFLCVCMYVGMYVCRYICGYVFLLLTIEYDTRGIGACVNR